MLEQIFNLTISQWLLLSIFFISSSIFGALIMYLFLRSVLKNMIGKSIHTYQLNTDDIIDNYHNGVNNVQENIAKIQDMTIKKFELIAQDISNLSKVLSHLKQHLVKIKSLENEIIKYKKIIKRLEKKQC